MRCVRVRNLVIGEGMPKIAVPVTAKREEEAAAAAAAAAACGDLIEFRADCFEGAADRERLRALLETIRRSCAIPILFTLRSAREGGELDCSDSLYKAILLSAIDSGLVDLVDVELASEGAADLVRRAREAGLPVIVSQHDFVKTPENECILRDLARMESLGGDIAKGAYMPAGSEDAARILALTREAADRLGIPVILISMGALGRASRVEGERWGSAVTFASLAGRGSAPGQIDVQSMRSLLEEEHRRLAGERALFQKSPVFQIKGTGSLDFA